MHKKAFLKKNAYLCSQNDPEARKNLQPTAEEHEYFRGIIADFIDLFDWSTIQAPLLKAELYREANEMEKCAEVLDSITYDQLKDFEKDIYDGIKTRMEKKDPIVFKLNV